MSSMLNATSMKIRICSKSKRWWNADIKERRRVVGEEIRRQNSEGAASVKAKLQMSTRQSKGTM
jgi:hypothetical protein